MKRRGGEMRIEKDEYRHDFDKKTCQRNDN